MMEDLTFTHLMALMAEHKGFAEAWKLVNSIMMPVGVICDV